MLAHYHLQQQKDASAAESQEGPPMSAGGLVEW